MDYLDETIQLKKENGNLSEALLMRKFKITAKEALHLIEHAERWISNEMEEKKSKLIKIEIHFTAEYE